MNFLLCGLACLVSMTCFAQRTIDVDKSNGLPDNTFFTVGGEPFVNTKFVRLTEGTPYFKDAWLPGAGFAANGDRYKAQLKLDLYDQQLHYLTPTGAEMIATTPLKQIALTDSPAGKTYHFVHSSLLPPQAHKQGWYLQLASGKVSLYQYFVKTVSEWQRYGTATKEQRIATAEEFYLVKPDAVEQIKKTKDLPALLPDKQKELEAWLRTNTKGKSTAEQLTDAVNYYNSLQ